MFNSTCLANNQPGFDSGSLSISVHGQNAMAPFQEEAQANPLEKSEQWKGKLGHILFGGSAEIKAYE